MNNNNKKEIKEEDFVDLDKNNEKVLSFLEKKPITYITVKSSIFAGQNKIVAGLCGDDDDIIFKMEDLNCVIDFGIDFYFNMFFNFNFEMPFITIKESGIQFEKRMDYTNKTLKLYESVSGILTTSTFIKENICYDIYFQEKAILNKELIGNTSLDIGKFHFQLKSFQQKYYVQSIKLTIDQKSYLHFLKCFKTFEESKNPCQHYTFLKSRFDYH